MKTEEVDARLAIACKLNGCIFKNFILQKNLNKNKWNEQLPMFPPAHTSEVYNFLIFIPVFQY